MKKIAICLIILILALVPFSVFSALAEDAMENYIVGSTEVQVWESDGFSARPSFYIPKGYGFTVVNPSVATDYAKIRYSGRDYFVLKSVLTACSKADSSSNLTPTLIVKISPKTLYGKPELIESSDYTGTLMFLGEYKSDGKTVCYAVYKADDSAKTTYYVAPNTVENLTDIQNLLNPPQINPGDDQKPTPTTPTTDSSDKTPENKTVLRIILVLGIVIPVFIIIIIVFKPRHKKQKVEREVDEGTDAFDNY